MSLSTADRQIKHRLAVLRHAEEVSGNVVAAWPPLAATTGSAGRSSTSGAAATTSSEQSSLHNPLVADGIETSQSPMNCFTSRFVGREPSAAFACRH